VDIPIEVARHVDAVGAEPSSDGKGHRRANPEGTRLVRGRHHDSSLVRAIAADDHRLAAELGMVALLDGRIERVQVAVEDRPRHPNRTPLLFAAGTRKTRRSWPSASIAARSFGASRTNGVTRSTASSFARARVHVPAANPSSITTASTIAFFE